MKTTLDLPYPLVEEVRRRAIRNEQEFGETFIGLVNKGREVAGSSPPKLESATVITSALGFPLIAGGRHARASEELTPERVAELLLDQETGWYHEASRHYVWPALTVANHGAHQSVSI